MAFLPMAYGMSVKAHTVALQLEGSKLGRRRATGAQGLIEWKDFIGPPLPYCSHFCKAAGSRVVFRQHLERTSLTIRALLQALLL